MNLNDRNLRRALLGTTSRATLGFGIDPDVQREQCRTEFWKAFRVYRHKVAVLARIEFEREQLRIAEPAGSA